ncbi:hypothetical protein GIB67_036044, partial [Kingdonia uniflora]
TFTIITLTLIFNSSLQTSATKFEQQAFLSTSSLQQVELTTNSPFSSFNNKLFNWVKLSSAALLSSTASSLVFNWVKLSDSSLLFSSNSVILTTNSVISRSSLL